MDVLFFCQLDDCAIYSIRSQITQLIVRTDDSAVGGGVMSLHLDIWKRGPATDCCRIVFVAPQKRGVRCMRESQQSANSAYYHDKSDKSSYNSVRLFALCILHRANSFPGFLFHHIASLSGDKALRHDVNNGAVHLVISLFNCKVNHLTASLLPECWL